MPARSLVAAAAVSCLGLVVPDIARAADPFAECLTRLEASKAGRRLAPATWQLVRGIRPDTAVLQQLNAQPEFRLPIWDYVAVMADQERVDDGRRELAGRRTIFDSVTTRYGVDAATVAAVWGIESNFGRNTGAYPVLRSLATLSCIGRRRDYFKWEFFAALRIVQAGHFPVASFNGSWAGAFGQTQFMPGIFETRAVDFDGDGKRDLLTNVGDALASTANYLRIAGWKTGLPWGVEVRLPTSDGAPFSTRGEGRRIRRSIATWAARGLTRVDGSPLAGDGLTSASTAGLFTPAGASGPAFLVTQNFEAIYRYNAAESYALAIAHLSDRLRGRGPITAAWPTDDAGLSRAERRELQRLLLARGHAIGPVDGLLLPPTRTAVRAEQQRLGQSATGRPGQKLLSALREAATPPTR